MAVFGWWFRLAINAFALAGGGYVVVTQHSGGWTALWLIVFAVILTRANDQFRLTEEGK